MATAAVLPPSTMPSMMAPDLLPIPAPLDQSPKARLPRPGLVEALMQLHLRNMETSDKEESESNDSQDSSGSSVFSRPSPAFSRASSATSFGSINSSSKDKAVRPGLRDSGIVTSSRRTSNLSAPSRHSWYNDLYRKLPSEVISCIVGHLETSHGQANTPAGYVKDLYSLSLTSRSWDRHVRPHLYHTLFLRFTELQPPPKKLFSKLKTRVKALRRTLRERPVLARHVKEIRVLDFSRDVAVSAEGSNEIRNQLASLVMACAGLERLTGLYPPHFHDHDRLSHALSTRRCLKEKLWVIGPNQQTAANGRLAPLSAPQIGDFIQLHSRWANLETLILSCAPGGVLDHHQMFFATLDHLPRLKNLHISGFSAYDFNDQHLHAIPPTLQALRLEALPGVSEEGLIHYMTSILPLDDRAHLTSLSLIDLNLHFLSSVASLLGHLYNLRRLTIVTSSLDPPSGIPVEEIWQPFCASRSLEYLHWEIKPWINSPSPDFAHYILAESIRAGGFPQLRRVRCPNDPVGIVQSACRPILPPSKLIVAPNGQFTERPPATCYTCAGHTPGKPSTACHAASLVHIRDRAFARAHTALYPARRVGHNAVCRYSVIEDTESYIRIVASDEEGMLIEAYDTPKFLGSLGPEAPEYWLDSDVEGCDAPLSMVEDVVLRETPRFSVEGAGKRVRWEGVEMKRLF